MTEKESITQLVQPALISKEALQLLVDALQSCANNEENPMETWQALEVGRAAIEQRTAFLNK